MWSLGCVLAELYLGWPLFPGTSEYDQINYICEMLGQPPHCLMRNMEKTKKFFNRSKGAWSIKVRDVSGCQLMWAALLGMCWVIASFLIDI